ncbi:MAG: hypothetical protein AB2758_20950 [Candidatus Thiodiazotropha endolucinida]
MALEDLEVKFDESPMKSAMDVYYEQLLSLIPLYEGEKLCLVSSLVTLPFSAKSDQYNNFLVRLIADRIIDYGSPKKLPENAAIGSLDTSEHFSSRYRDYAQSVLDKHLVELSTDQLEKYTFYENQYGEELKKYNSKLRELMEEWKTHREANYPGKGDADLALEKATYFNNRGGDFDHLRQMRTKMRRQRALMGSILRSGDAASKLALSVISALDDSEQYFPNDSATAEKYDMDAVWLGNPINTIGNPPYLDKRPSYLNTFKYEALARKGARELTILSTSSSNDEHLKSWSAKASVRYGFFFKARAEASETTKTTNAVKAINKVEIKFEHLYETLVGRGNWYNKDIFDSGLVGSGDEAKKMSARLKYAVKSIIVARGLKLLLHFEDEQHATNFRQFSASGSARVSFLGGLLPLGGGGRYNSVDKGDDSQLDKRIVSFNDAADVVRMVGYRVEKVHDHVSDTELIALMKNGAIDLEEMEAVFSEQFKATGFDFSHELL